MSARLSKKGRRQIAKTWIPTFEGGNLIEGYCDYFDVSPKCAIKELESLGYEVDLNYKNKVFLQEKQRRRIFERQKYEREYQEKYAESNEYFSFIAGYTSNGLPYGTPWEDEEPNHQEQDQDIIKKDSL